MSEWHVSPELAQAYSADAVDDAVAWSVETHLEQCGVCARAVSATVVDPALAVVRERLLHQVSSPGRGFLRLTLSPALTVPWLVAVAGVVVGVTVLDLIGAVRDPLLLLVAPLLPLLGVGLGCARGVDPSAELVASTPTPALRALLLRAAAVLVVSVAPLLVVSGVTGVGPVAWLAPSAALVALALALATVVRVELATGLAAGVWAVFALGPAALEEGLPWVFAPPAQAAWVVAAAVLLVVLMLRRGHLDEEGFAR